MLGDYVTLSNGTKMPLLGFGTFQIKQYEDIERCLDCALHLGYRLIDTAAVYRNEEHIGKCLPSLLKKHNLERKDVFITTKLSPRDHGHEGAKLAVQSSLSQLGLEYVDLYLIHWPGKQGLRREDPVNTQSRKESWSALEGIYTDSKQIRAIGVSNYNHNQLIDLLAHCRTPPAVLQSEFHPDYQQQEVLKLCKEKSIHFQSYSTLGRGKLAHDDRFSAIAKMHTRSVPQVLLRWAIQKGCSVIPKSCNPTRIEENSKIFDFALESSEVDHIDSVGRNVKYCWDPTDVA